jgi:uncharacterized protein YndB with AHSA1/START domain
MVKKILIALGVVIAGFLVFAATRPDKYHVERSTTIHAPAEVVFASIADLKAFGEWSPWDKRDPAMQKTYSATTSGVGASYAWKGNKQVGSGKMTITEVKPPNQVREKLEFIEPFANVAEISFDVVPAGTGEVKTTWAMDGHSKFPMKVIGIFMDMDKAIGKDFDAGLANLKHVTEAKAAAAPAAPPTAAVEPAK